jgi:hypothetical protein
MRLVNYLNESLQRYCHIYKAKNGKWYLELANREYAGREDATTYGPFNSMEDADKEISDWHSNPGGLSIDKSGKKPVPKKSPNGLKVQKPTRQQRNVYSFGGPRRFR